MADRDTRSSVITRVEFVLEASSGPFGGDWKLEDVQRVAKREAEEAASKLIGIAAQNGIRLTVVKVGSGCSVKFEPEKP